MSTLQTVVSSEILNPTSLSKINSNFTTLNADKLEASDIIGKQDTLVSWTNIKTINTASLLWSGNISIPALTDWDKSDIVVSWSGTVWTVDNDAVTFAKMQNIATNKILGRTTAWTWDTEELTPTQVAWMLPVATISAAWTMSASDKTKLDNLDTWTLLTTMNLAGLSSTESSWTLTSYNKYRLEYDLFFSDTTTIIGMQCNSQTGTIYNTTQIFTSTVSTSTWLNGFLVAQANSDYVAFWEMIINATRASYKPIYWSGYTWSQLIKGIMNYWTNITSFQFFRWTWATNVTWTVKIYWKN